MRDSQSGFTLIELMVTLSIVAILLSLSVGMQELVMNNRRAAAINEFIAAINFTRNDAITRGQQVSMCRSANQTSCANGAGWEDGWIIFLDRTNPGVLDDADPWDADPAEPNGEVLKIHGPVTGLTLRGNANVANFISYNAGGSAFTPPTNGTIMACDSRGLGTAPNFHARRIVIATTGRMNTIKAKAGDICP
ncbi:MAG: GspH/FimT family pseudopilin [Nevskiales bacterium]